MMDQSCVLTPAYIASRVAEQWRDQFYTSRKNVWYSQERRDQYDRLVALGPNPQPTQVEAIIQSRAWTMVPTCSECGDPEPPFVIMVGVLEEDQVYLCPGCIREIANLANNQRPSS